MTEIYMLNHRTSSDGYDGRSWDEYLEPEEGFFTDKAEAEAEAERLMEGAYTRYEHHKGRVMDAYQKDMEVVQQIKAQRDFLEAHGRTPLGDPPQEPREPSFPEFPRWAANNYVEIIEVVTLKERTTKEET